MDNLGNPPFGEDQPSTAEPKLETFPDPASRRDTRSSISRSPLPPGKWTLSIHGNCSRCHHHHKATVVRIDVSDDPEEPSHIICEGCNEKWLTIGGRNVTQLSLLSTQTNDSDPEETRYRSALIYIVQSAMSATAFAAPTALPSVPEAPSGLPSRGNSTRSPTRIPMNDTETQTHSASDHDTQALNHIPVHNTTSSSPDNRRLNSRTEPSNRVELSKKALKRIKRKLQDTFPTLKDRLKKLIPTPRQRKRAKKVKGKQPAIETMQDSSRSLHSGTSKGDNLENHVNRTGCEQATQTEEACRLRKTADQAIAELDNIDKQVIQNMTPDERRAWIREQITAFKCCTSHSCSCRRRRSSTIHMVDSSAQADLPPPEPYRRHSADILFGLGSHFDVWPHGNWYQDNGTLSISATRTSDAETAVEAPTFPSSPRQSWVDHVRNQRHRSLSPQPPSVVPSRHSFRHHVVGPRASLDSIVTGAGFRSASRRRGTDRYSGITIAPTTIPSRTDSPDAASRNEFTTPEDSPRPDRRPSDSSTSRLNDYLTDDEHNQEPEPPGPMDSSNP